VLAVLKLSVSKTSADTEDAIENNIIIARHTINFFIYFLLIYL
jgi:hypothetical protein